MFLPWPAYQEFQKAHEGYLKHQGLKETEHGERAFALHCVIVGVRSVVAALNTEATRGNLVQPVSSMPPGIAEAAKRIQAIKEGQK